MVSYRVTLDIPRELAPFASGLLADIGTRPKRIQCRVNIRSCRRPRGLPCRRSDVYSGRHQLADGPGAALARSGLLAIVAPGEGS